MSGIVAVRFIRPSRYLFALPRVDGAAPELHPQRLFAFDPKKSLIPDEEGISNASESIIVDSFSVVQSGRGILCIAGPASE
jgi:hypothetical protein